MSTQDFIQAIQAAGDMKMSPPNLEACAICGATRVASYTYSSAKAGYKVTFPILYAYSFSDPNPATNGHHSRPDFMKQVGQGSPIVEAI